MTSWGEKDPRWLRTRNFGGAGGEKPQSQRHRGTLWGWASQRDSGTGPHHGPSRGRKLPECEFSQMWPQCCPGRRQRQPHDEVSLGTLGLPPLGIHHVDRSPEALCSLAGKTLFKLVTPPRLTLLPSCVRQAVLTVQGTALDLGGHAEPAGSCPPRPACQGQTCEQAVTLALENEGGQGVMDALLRRRVDRLAEEQSLSDERPDLHPHEHALLHIPLRASEEATLSSLVAKPATRDCVGPQHRCQTQHSSCTQGHCSVKAVAVHWDPPGPIWLSCAGFGF